MRLESPTFKGTNECEYADEPINEIKKILGIQEVLNDKWNDNKKVANRLNNYSGS